ncbi:hypothetical protein P7K49_023138 [Saguinus oedipus]|uniref:Uncharacterized protein n=1 Tax=Saguinus oedipus TaxID=9490 RepID=A0ABQ9UN35_SAGOE|nr:hypothetical protein P7K49_023138 [Saguinus oedipus]
MEGQAARWSWQPRVLREHRQGRSGWFPATLRPRGASSGRFQVLSSNPNAGRTAGTCSSGRSCLKGSGKRDVMETGSLRSKSRGLGAGECCQETDGGGVCCQKGNPVELAKFQACAVVSNQRILGPRRWVFLL